MIGIDLTVTFKIRFLSDSIKVLCIPKLHRTHHQIEKHLPLLVSRKRKRLSPYLETELWEHDNRKHTHINMLLY